MNNSSALPKQFNFRGYLLFTLSALLLTSLLLPALLTNSHVAQAHEPLIPAAAPPTANFTVTYATPFTPQQQADLKAALDIWASVLVSPVPIKVLADLTTDPSLCGYATSGKSQINFRNAPKPNTYYPPALASALAGSDLNPADYDVNIIANSKCSITGTMTHELGHALGFTSSLNVVGSTGIRSLDAPNIYDSFLFNGDGQALTNTQLFPDGSDALYKQLVSDNLYFKGTNTLKAYNNPKGVKIFAPTTWKPGSSISHTDYSALPATGVNGLMGPGGGNLGPVVLAMMQDMGWQLAPPPGPVPAITTLQPNSATVNSSFILTINGTGFIPNTSVVYVDDEIYTKSPPSDTVTQVTTSFDPAFEPKYMAKDKYLKIQIFNPYPTGGGLSNTVYIKVGLPPTTTTLTSSSNSVVLAQAVTFSATVKSGEVAAVGTVTFQDNGVTIGTATLNTTGVATFTTSSLAKGSHSITAVYAGSGTDFGASNSTPLIQSVTDLAPVINLLPSTVRIAATIGDNPNPKLVAVDNGPVAGGTSSVLLKIGATNGIPANATKPFKIGG